MFNEATLHKYPALIVAFTGIPTSPSGQLANGRVLVDATEQRVYRPGKSNQTHKLYYSVKQKAFTIKTQMATDDDHHLLAISASAPAPCANMT